MLIFNYMKILPTEIIDLTGESSGSDVGKEEAGEVMDLTND